MQVVVRGTDNLIQVESSIFKNSRYIVSPEELYSAEIKRNATYLNSVCGML